MNVIKNFNEKIDNLLETPKTSETQEITAEDFVLIQFSTKTTKVFYTGKVEGKEFFTYKVKVKQRHGETSHLTLSDKDNMSKIEGEYSVTKLPRPIFSYGTARTTTLKYSSANFSGKELCRQRNSVILWALSS